MPRLLRVVQVGIRATALATACVIPLRFMNVLKTINRLSACGRVVRYPPRLLKAKDITIYYISHAK